MRFVGLRVGKRGIVVGVDLVGCDLVGGAGLLVLGRRLSG